jgi:hypothetical protein
VIVVVVGPAEMLTGMGSAGVAVMSYEEAPVPGSFHARSTPVDPLNVAVQVICGGQGVPCAGPVAGPEKRLPFTTRAVVTARSPPALTEKETEPLQGSYVPTKKFASNPVNEEVEHVEPIAVT